jgi:SAM-dependent methyltransferase
MFSENKQTPQDLLNKQDRHELCKKEIREQQRNSYSEGRIEEKENKPIKDFLEKELENYKDEKILNDGSGYFPETYLPEEYAEKYNVCHLDWVKLPIVNSHKGDAEALPFADSEFGVVLANKLWGYLENPEKGLKEMVRVLKPGGLLILIDWEGNLKGKGLRTENFEPEKVVNEIKSMDFNIIKTERLIDRTEKEKNVYLTAIVAKKNKEN